MSPIELIYNEEVQNLDMSILHPEGVFYTGVKPEDVEKIVKNLGKPVKEKPPVNKELDMFYQQQQLNH